jgi:hypothetical protein
MARETANEVYSDLSHGELAEYVACLRASSTRRCKREFRLPNNKIADVISLDHEGLIEIYECKVWYRPGDDKLSLHKYLPYAHILWLVYPEPLPVYWQQYGTVLAWHEVPRNVLVATCTRDHLTIQIPAAADIKPREMPPLRASEISERLLM